MENIMELDLETKVGDKFHAKVDMSLKTITNVVITFNGVAKSYKCSNKSKEYKGAPTIMVYDCARKSGVRFSAPQKDMEV